MSKIPPEFDSMRGEAAKMVERLYRPLVEELDLTSQQGEAVYQILLEFKMSGIVQRAELLCHEDVSKLAKSADETQKDTDERLLALLGEAKFSQYQKYQTSVGDRGTLEMIRSDFAAQPLTEEQRMGLLRAMSSARRECGGDPGGKVGFSIADASDVTAQKLKRQASVDQQILQQAAAFLSPAQGQILDAALAKLRAWRQEGFAKAQEMSGNRATAKQNDSPPSS
jgi:hypothetical protein